MPEKIQTINLLDHKAFKSVFFQGGRLQEYFHTSKPTTMKKPDFKAFGGVRILTHLLKLDYMKTDYTYITDSLLTDELKKLYKENGIKIY